MDSPATAPLQGEQLRVFENRGWRLRFALTFLWILFTLALANGLANMVNH